MHFLVAALAMTTFSAQVPAGDRVVFAMTNAETAAGFETLADCEQALGEPDQRTGLRGSLFNREAGNISRCELVDGEALVVVYPKGYAPRPVR